MSRPPSFCQVRAMSLPVERCASQMASERVDTALLQLACAWRILVLLLICTTFVPDEYYQYVEPSFNAIANQGIRYFYFCVAQLLSIVNNFQLNENRTWEWDDQHRIRSYLPLMPLISGYKLLNLVVCAPPFQTQSCRVREITSANIFFRAWTPHPIYKYCRACCSLCLLSYQTYTTCAFVRYC